MKNRRFSSKKKTNLKTVIFGVILNAAAFAIFALFLAFILSGTKNPLGLAGYTSLALLVTCGAVGGFFTSKYKGENGTLPSAISAVIFALIIIFSGLIMSGSTSGVTIVNTIFYVISAILFAYLAARRKRRKRR